MVQENDEQTANGMDIKECCRKVSHRFWMVIIALPILIMIILDDSELKSFESTHLLSLKFVQHDVVTPQDTLKGFLIKTPGCRIPEMKAFDPSIKKCIYEEKNPICNKGIPPLFASNLTSIFLINSSVANYVELSSNMIECCYVPFYRLEPEDDGRDNNIKFSDNCIPFEFSARISEEFIKVVCHSNQKVIYNDFFSFVPIKTVKKYFATKPLNVLIVGLDAVSRLNFHRQMPKTAKYLNALSAVELLGFNKVGDNTFPNIIPFLTGLSEEQLQEACWNNDHDGRFDDCPFIWKSYKAEGFVTSFGEDASWMGIFNYMRKGFKTQPTDYTWGYFNRKSEAQIGNSHNLNVKECVGAREVYKVSLEYIKNFVTTMHSENLPYFSFFWGASLSHDFLNKPHLGDKSYYKFFKHLNVSGYLEDTVLFFMSDHGIRWGEIRRTYQGQMEERLPFVFVILPDWYKKRYPEPISNLRKNVRRLTTHFDLHETLKDLLHPYRLTHDFLKNKYTHSSRGYSLFTEITNKRTCEDAGIASHWCTCQQSVKIDKNDSVVVEGTNFVLDYINQQLRGYQQCAKLVLLNISDAKIMTHTKAIAGRKEEDYTITLETVPGNGIFEVTLRNSKSNNATNQFEVMGTISRLNLYGKQSSCITDFHLKLYCYCKSLLQ